MSFVLDASITLSWCFKDEVSIETEKLLDKAASGVDIWVPSLWTLEVTNILLLSEKKKRIDYSGLLDFLTRLQIFQIHVDHTTVACGFHEILFLAYNEKLTTYDASYLELAMRKKLPLASKDKALSNVSAAS